MIPTMLGVLILLPILGFLANGSIAFFGKPSNGDGATTQWTIQGSAASLEDAWNEPASFRPAA